MENSVIKWVLIGGALYLVYRYLETSGYLGAPQQLPPGQGLPPEQPAVTSKPAVTAEDVADSISAAPGFYLEGGGNTQNAYQWNYWWMRSALNTARRDAAPAELGIEDTTEMTL